MDSENENDLPEVYTDSFRFTLHPYGVAFTFGTNGQGRQIHSVVGYESHPMKIVTAYHPSDDVWIDGRTRR